VTSAPHCNHSGARIERTQSPGAWGEAGSTFSGLWQTVQDHKREGGSLLRSCATPSVNPVLGQGSLVTVPPGIRFNFLTQSGDVLLTSQMTLQDRSGLPTYRNAALFCWTTFSRRSRSPEMSLAQGLHTSARKLLLVGYTSIPSEYHLCLFLTLGGLEDENELAFSVMSILEPRLGRRRVQRGQQW